MDRGDLSVRAGESRRDSPTKQGKKGLCSGGFSCLAISTSCGSRTLRRSMGLEGLFRNGSGLDRGRVESYLAWMPSCTSDLTPQTKHVILSAGAGEGNGEGIPAWV